MAIDLQKINVKFYLAEDAVLSPEDAFRIFSQWIPETKDEVLIDVADYQHVPQGPKTVLVGHEANYTLDNTDGRYGLLYGQKATAQGSNAERLKSAIASALKACRRLERGDQRPPASCQCRGHPRRDPRRPRHRPRRTLRRGFDAG